MQSSPLFNEPWWSIPSVRIHPQSAYVAILFMGERQDGAATGNGSPAVVTLLPPNFSGTTTGKHPRVD